MTPEETSLIFAVTMKQRLQEAIANNEDVPNVLLEKVDTYLESIDINDSKWDNIRNQIEEMVL